MKYNILLLVALAVTLAVSDKQGSAQDALPRRDAEEARRYQLVASLDGRIFLLDSATGHCWSRTPGGDWQDEGNPTQTKEGKRASTPHEPPQLELPSKTVEMTVIQREERAIPGSDGSVRLRLGDITEGQVFLTVVTADGDMLLKRTSVAQGDKVEFAVGKRKYILDIKELRNILIGDDFAKISVAEATEKNPSDKRRSSDQDR